MSSIGTFGSSRAGRYTSIASTPSRFKLYASELLLGKKLTREEYLALDHVLVSYNGDLRGIVEDYFGLQRRVRVSVPTFGHVAPALDDTSLLATVPVIVAQHIVGKRPSFRTVAVPLPLKGTPLELLWRNAQSDDEALRFIRGHITRIAKAAGAKAKAPRARR